MSENKRTNKEAEFCLGMLKDKPVYKKMVEEGVFTEEQLDLCIKMLYENDLKEENK